MAEDRQELTFIKPIAIKKGVPIYESNPSIPSPDSISKKKPVRFGNSKRGFIVSSDSGEIVNVGGAAFFEYEEVDETRFVKLFLAGVKQAAGLSKAGLTLFELVYKELQKTPNVDRVGLSFYTSAQFIPMLTERTYHRGLRELLDRQFLFKSPIDGIYFINVKYMFNGDRLAFIKGYTRKNTKKILNEFQDDIFSISSE
jgi:hypothetical protein